MPVSRVAFAVALVATALVVQVTLLSRLPLPGATPDAVLLAVVGLALAYGPGFGLVAGFAAGMGLDLVPPADHAIGRWALVLTVIGYLAGLARRDARRSVLVPIAVVGVAAALSVLLYAGLGELMDPHITWATVSDVLTTAIVYDVLLSPFVVSAVLVGAHRVEVGGGARR